MADAASMKPKFIPDAFLLGRDDSGGFNYQPYTGQWGDGGFTTGDKKHLSVSGGTDPEIVGDEQDSTVEARNANKGPRDKAPASSKREARN